MDYKITDLSVYIIKIIKKLFEKVKKLLRNINEPNKYLEEMMMIVKNKTKNLYEDTIYGNIR